MNLTAAKIFLTAFFAAIFFFALFVSYKCVNGWSVESDKSYLAIFELADKGDVAFLQANIDKIKGRSIRRSAQFELDRIAEVQPIATSDFNSLYLLNFLRRIEAGEKISELEIRKSAENMYGNSELEKTSFGKRLVRHALKNKNFETGENIVAALNLDMMQYSLDAYYNGANGEDLKRIPATIKDMMQLLFATRTDSSAKLKEQIDKNYKMLLGENLYLFRKSILIQCYANIGQFEAALEILEDLQKRTKKMGSEYYFLRDNLNIMTAKFLLFNNRKKDFDRFLNAMKFGKPKDNFLLNCMFDYVANENVFTAIDLLNNQYAHQKRLVDFIKSIFSEMFD